MIYYCSHFYRFPTSICSPILCAWKAGSWWASQPEYWSAVTMRREYETEGVETCKRMQRAGFYDEDSYEDDADDSSDEAASVEQDASASGISRSVPLPTSKALSSTVASSASAPKPGAAAIKSRPQKATGGESVPAVIPAVNTTSSAPTFATSSAPQAKPRPSTSKAQKKRGRPPKPKA